MLPIHNTHLVLVQGLWAFLMLHRLPGLVRLEQLSQASRQRLKQQGVGVGVGVGEELPGVRVLLSQILSSLLFWLPPTPPPLFS